MTDPLPVPPKPRAGIWPIAAMALVVGMLATVLVFQVIRRNEGDRTNRPPVHTVDRPTPPVDPPVTPADPTTPQDDPKEKQALAKLEEAKKALADGRLDLAQAALSESRKLTELPDAAKLDEAIKAEIARRQKEEQDRVRRELVAKAEALAEDARKLWEEGNHYEQAEALINDAVRAEPGLKGQPALDVAVATLKRLAGEALKEWQKKVDLARDATTAKRYAEAIRLLRLALTHMPDKPETPLLIAEVYTKMRSANMVRIPGALKFKLGTAGREDEPEREYAGPGFLIDVFEVTNEDYFTFLQESKREPPASHYWNAGKPDARYVRFPVTNVTAADAEAYAKWMGKRLPTEDEWEYAARAIDGRLFPWGSEFPAGREARCNCIEWARVSASAGLVEVGRFANGATPHGVQDMSGNAAEWTSTDAVKGDAKLRVIKGGSFMTSKDLCRAAARFVDDPELPHHEVGFRCVLDLEK